MLEAQAEYAVRSLRRMQRQGISAIEVRPSFEALWYAWLQSKMKGTSWTMSSNYFTAPTGGTAILSTSQVQNEWVSNPMITFGVSYIFSR